MAVPGTNLVRLSQPGNILSLELTPPASGVITPLSLPQLLTGNNGVIGITLNPDGTLPFAGFDTPLNRGNTVMTGRINTVNRNVNFPAIPRVQVLGDRVALLNAVIKANSVYGGGTVLIGGEYLGQGIIPTAQFTFADTNTRIRANGIGNSNGGRVIAWANNTARFFGTINARGGALGGNGGFIETSGKLSLDISGIRVNASAPLGNPGVWLIDPAQVDIVAGTGFTGGTFAGGIFSPDGVTDPTTIGADYITSLLNAGTSVSIETNPNPAGGSGDINVNSFLNVSPPTGGATLSLLAARDINVNAKIASANNTNPLNLNLNTLTGSVNVNAEINTRGGNFVVDAHNSFFANAFITTFSNNSNSGNINIRARNGSIETQGLRSSNSLFGRRAGSVTLDAPLAITVSTINSSGTGGSRIGNSINITTNGLFLANDTLTAPPICVEVGASLCSYGSTTSGNITIQHGGGIITPFVVGGATNNGTVGGIYSTSLLSSITVTTPPAVNSYLADTITITTTVPSPSPSPTPLPSPAPSQSSLAIAPEILTLLRNPEAPPTPPPVVVGTPPVPDSTLESIPNPIPELPPIPSPSPTPILVSNPPNPLPTNLLTTPLETAQLSISLREGYANATPSPTLTSTLTREQVNQFARDFRGGQSLILGGTNIPLVAGRDTLSAIQQFSTGEARPPLQTISTNSEVNPAIIYIFFGQPEANLERTHEQMRLAVERSSLTPRDDDQLEIVVIFKNGEPIHQTLELTRREVVNLVDQFRREITAYETDPRAYMEPSQQLYQWLIAPIAPELQARQVNNLNFLLDGELRSLPLAALHNGQEFLIESYSLALLPPLDQTQAQPEFMGLVIQSEGIFRLASLWDVDKDATLGVVTNFSDQLTAVPLRAEALRRTQLAMLRPQIPTAAATQILTAGRSIPVFPDFPEDLSEDLSEDFLDMGDRNFSHPYFWSAFTLVENPW